MLKNKTILRIILLCLLAIKATLAQANDLTQNSLQEQQIITRSSQIEVKRAPAGNFTGEAHFSRYPIMPATGNVAPAIVTFSPSSRTDWHTHLHGQYLIITEGEGQIQEWGKPIQTVKKGDVIWCAAGVKHWHGATRYSSMTHVTISQVSDDKQSVIWLERPELTVQYTTKETSNHASQLISATTPLRKSQLSLIPIASYTASGDLAKLSLALNQGLDHGLTINEIKEAITHLYAYAGFPRSLNGLMTLQTVLKDRQEKDINDEQGVEPTSTPENIDYYQLGIETMEFLTEASAQRPLFDFSPSIDYSLKAHLFGYLFSRDNLSYVNRELVTISVLSTLSLDSQLLSHLRVGKNLGMRSLQFEQIINTLKPVSLQASINVKTIVDTKL